MVKDIYYQSSLPRAGSTLLQNILGQNPELYVTPTSGVLELIYSARGQYSTSLEFKAQDSKLMREGFLKFCKEGMYGFYNAITDKPYVIDKSRGWGIHYNFLETIHGEPKIICMVRDLRSIFASMEKNFKKHPEMDDGTVNWADGKGTTTEKRVKLWADTPPIGIAVERLKQIIDEGNDKHILFVKFEDLVTIPKFEMERIYRFLGLPNFKHDFNNVEQITQEDDAVYGIFGDHTIKKEVKYFDPKYNEILGEQICQNIVGSYQWFYEYFNYKN
jgi:sulfotransferase